MRVIAHISLLGEPAPQAARCRAANRWHNEGAQG